MSCKLELKREIYNLSNEYGKVLMLVLQLELDILFTIQKHTYMQVNRIHELEWKTQIDNFENKD